MAEILTQALEESPRGRVFKLALPAVGEQLLNTLVGLADVYLVGNLSREAAAQLGYSSDVALAGVGLGNQMIWVTLVFFMAAGVASTALVARATGAGDNAERQHVLRQSMLIGVGVGLFTTLLVTFGAGTFLALLNTPDEVLPRSLEYLHIISFSLLPTALLFVGTACMRGAGDTRTPLYIMLGANTLNVAVTWLLVSGNLSMPALGVEGAAIGTALARGGAGLVVLGLLLRGQRELRLVPDVRPDMGRLRRLVAIGAPTAGEMLIFHGALLIFTRFVTGLGTTAYAAHNATITIESLSFLPGMGYAVAAGALVGQGLGARDPARAERDAFEALWQGMAMMTVIGALMIAVPDLLLSFFVNVPAVVAAGTSPLRAAGMVQPALAVGFILNGALRGAGDTSWPLYTRIFTTWMVRLPITLLLVGTLDLGLNGIWLAMCTDFTLQGLLALWRFSRGRWQTVEV
jgi:putative MATE family efflux protein